MTKLHVVVRTCDNNSLVNNRIVPKNECIFRCLKSLVDSLANQNAIEYTLHIIDDRSSEETLNKIKTIAHNAIITSLPERDDSSLNGKQKSRHSVKVAYEYIHTLPDDDLVYIVEDDYLHYPETIQVMIDAWSYFNEFFGGISVGIFPQDFPQLYPHPRNPHNETYVKPCFVIPGPDRYYRTTWYTHESFMVPVSVIKKYKENFDSLLTIGNDPALWEGNTISTVWAQDDVKMLMPMRALAIHVSSEDDIPFFNNDFGVLWLRNNVS